MTVDQSARVRHYYDTQTSHYLRTWDREDLHFGLFRASGAQRKDALRAMTDAVAMPAMITEDDLVIDIGSGVGGAAYQIAGATGCRVLGVTISGVQAKIASDRGTNDALSRQAVAFVQGDCSAVLPIATRSVDVIVSIEAACHLKDKEGLARECARVLKPDGRLALSDWMATSARSPTKQIDEVCDAWNLGGLLSIDQWQQVLQKADFEIYEREDFGDATIDNAHILERANLELQLEEANGSLDTKDAALWRYQYESLCDAWFSGEFTIGRLAGRLKQS